MVKVLYSRIVFETLCSLLKLRQFNLHQFASVYSAANEYQHCWESTSDELASCPGGSVQLHSKLLALNY